jgi:TolA-binding protein
LTKAELDILRKDMASLHATNDSLQAILGFSSSYAAPVTPAAQPDELPAQPTSTLPPEPEPVVSAPDDLPVVSPAADFQRAYEQALALFKEKKYTQSAESFAELLQRDRSHRLSSNCQYWIGECLYAQGQFESALAEFQKVFAYPASLKADVAQFKIALCYMQMNKNDEAREEFNRLIAAFPNSDYVARARTHLDKLP